MLSSNKKLLSEANSAYQSALHLIANDMEFDILVENFLKKADQLNHPFAAGDLGILLFKKAKHDSEYFIAYKYLHKATLLNHKTAILYSAFCFLKGLGTEQSTEQAIYLFNQFIKSSHVAGIPDSTKDNLIYAFLSLAEIYLSTQYGFLSPDKAYFNLCRAEQLGSLVAKFNLANLLLKRCTSEVDPIILTKLQKIWLLKYTELADMHYDNTEFTLGCYYAYPNKSPTLAFIRLDLVKAIDYFWRAGLGGNYTSFYHIYKISQEINPDLSIRCLELAVKLKVSVACLEYGSAIFYRDGLSDLERIKGLEIVKSLAITTNNDVAQYASGLMTIALFENEADIVIKENHFWTAIDFLRKAAKAPHYFAKFELSKFLMEHGNHYINHCQSEIRHHLKRLIDFASPTINPNIIHIQALAKVMLEALPPVVENLPKKKVSKKIFPTKARNDIHRFGFSQSKTKKRYPYSYALPSDVISLTHTPLIDNIPTPVVNEPIVLLKAKPDMPNREKIDDSICQILPLTDQLSDIMSLFEKHKYVAYIVGGYVRDKLIDLHCVVKDVDIITSAPIEFIENAFQIIRSVHIQTLCTVNLDGTKFDIQSVEGIEQSLIQDAMQRDFTINALYLNSLGHVLDPLKQGLDDLFSTNSQLVSIGDFSESIAADPFRVLRLLMFISRGYTSQCNDLEIQNYIKCFATLLRGYLKKTRASSLTDDVIEEKVKMFGKFDHYLCKFFLNNYSETLFDLVLRLKMLPIVFPNIRFHDSDLLWMKDKLSNLHNKTSLPRSIPTRKAIYLILLTTMISDMLDLDNQLRILMENNPLPNDLRWKISSKELKVYVNEKNFFNLLAPEKKLQLSDISNSQIQYISSSQAYKTFTNATSSANEFLIAEPQISYPSHARR